MPFNAQMEARQKYAQRNDEWKFAINASPVGRINDASFL